MADHPHEGELRALARRLFEEGARMMRLKPRDDVRDSVRGLPAVMAELACAEGPLSPGELARAIQVTDARIANILRSLEERGWVERRPSTGDRRRVEVVLTEGGRAEARVRAEEAERFLVSFLHELGLDDARELVRVVGRVNDVMEMRRAEGRQAASPAARPRGGGRA